MRRSYICVGSTNNRIHLELLKDINERMGLTTSSPHEMKVIREICDRVAVIEGGVILEEGSTLEVFTNPKKPTTKDFVGLSSKR